MKPSRFLTPAGQVVNAAAHEALAARASKVKNHLTVSAPKLMVISHLVEIIQEAEVRHLESVGHRSRGLS